jgi:hypothetical protein
MSCGRDAHLLAGALHRAAREVHEGLRLEEGDLAAGEHAARREADELLPPLRARRALVQASSTMKPALWRCRLYWAPGLPRPTRSFMAP